jgi:hypothetical protein
VTPGVDSSGAHGGRASWIDQRKKRRVTHESSFILRARYTPVAGACDGFMNFDISSRKQSFKCNSAGAGGLNGMRQTDKAANSH